MKQTSLVLSFALLAAPLALVAQSSSSSSTLVAEESSFGGGAGQASSPIKSSLGAIGPLSRVAVSAGISPMGIQLQVATNLSRHFNVRGTGNFFNYTVNNITVDSSGGTNGFNLKGTVNFASAGASLDYYPFPNHGFRVSPGALFYNQNNISASAIAAGGTSFTLNSQKYYSDSAAPLNVAANLGLNTNNPAITITTGWGDMIPRRGGHWSFPFEIGAAFTGVPALSVGLTGSACTNQADAAANGPSCVIMATNATAQTNLNAQVATYKNDLNPLQVYPIISIGLAYSFRIR